MSGVTLKHLHQAATPTSHSQPQEDNKRHGWSKAMVWFALL